MSVKLEWTVNGNNVSPDRFEVEVMAMLLENAKVALQAQIEIKLKDVNCSSHNQHPHVTVTGSTLDDLKYSIEGCCEQLINDASKVLTNGGH